jgi:alkanesulfonate monooxygenase SsuD/methylene tetrahydromethanopterin reductase-like flavin-dependent oxidoreductase (luciferase family)
MSRPVTRMQNANKFKLGLFGTNCSGGLTMTKAPEHWVASWENNLQAAQLADDAGIEFLLPLARWLGQHGATNTQESTFETLTWASALLASTREISAFGTVHVSLIHPVFAAKQIVTVDHVGRGRFGLNVVSGWNEGEFGMFGVDLLEHDERYAFTEEWVTIARRIWVEEEPFDFDGRYFTLRSVLGKPKPYGQSGGPLLMSAGSSRAGQAFAARHADCLFMVIVDLERLPGDIQKLHALADRRIGVYASGHLIARPTTRQAQEYYHYIVRELGDWEAAEFMMASRISGNVQSMPHEKMKEIKERFISGSGTYPVVGSYDDVAESFRRLNECGLDGMAIGLVNYIDEFPILRDEVLPRMERLGLREPIDVVARAQGRRSMS